MREIEEQRRALTEQRDKIAEETKVASDNLKKARAEFLAAQDKKDEMSRKVDESIQAVRREDLSDVYLGGAAQDIARDILE